MLPRQNYFGKLTFLLSALNISFPLTNKLSQQTHTKFCVCLTEINTNFFFWCTKTSINTKVGASPSAKNHSCNCQHEMMNLYQYQEL